MARYFIPAFVTLIVLFQQSSGKCVPGAVTSVSLAENYTLYWNAAQNEQGCNISSYVIYIKDIEEGTLQLYTTSFKVLEYNVDFLELCTSYSFEVHALTSANVLGPASTHAFTTAPSADLNLNLTVNSVTHADNKMDISWVLAEPKVGKCINFYRLVYWDETENPKDVYVSNTSFTLAGEVPCMKYEFQVRAIVGTPEIEGPFSLSKTSTFGQVPNPPKISSIASTDTTVTMVWNVDSYDKNRCEVLYLEIDTLGAKDSPRRIIYKDSAKRPPFRFTLHELEPGTVYTSHVFIVNNSGASKNTTITFQTNEKDSTLSKHNMIHLS